MPDQSIVPSLETLPDQEYLSRKELQQPVPLPEPAAEMPNAVESEIKPPPREEI